MQSNFKPLPKEILDNQRNQMSLPVSVRLPKDVKANLTQMAKENNLSMNTLLLSIIIKFNNDYTN